MWTLVKTSTVTKTQLYLSNFTSTPYSTLDHETLTKAVIHLHKKSDICFVHSFMNAKINKT